jgi:DNA invertase Pin-like site-specific DNA recombinase
VETGKRKERPELANAVAHCGRAKATLVVAKLARLARNVAFTSALMESKVDFVWSDNPHANKLTIHILAAVTVHEGEATSQRTKAALATAKARGVKLGSAPPGHWDGREDRRLASAKAVKTAVREGPSGGLPMLPAYSAESDPEGLELPVRQPMAGRGLKLRCC